MYRRTLYVRRAVVSTLSVERVRMWIIKSKTGGAICVTPVASLSGIKAGHC